jgi:hypothetical protein
MVRIPRVDRGSSDLADFQIFADEKKMKEDETDLRAGFGSWRELMGETDFSTTAASAPSSIEMTAFPGLLIPRLQDTPGTIRPFMP